MSGSSPIQSPLRSPAKLTVRHADYPALYQLATGASQRHQIWRRRLVTANLVAIVAAATLSGITAYVPDPLSDALIALFAFVLVGPMATNYLIWRRGDEKSSFEWLSVAESVTTGTWRYMMRVEPYANNTTCDDEFVGALNAIVAWHKHILYETGVRSIGSRHITDRMREVRQLGHRRRHDVYVRERLDERISWYREQARRNDRLDERWTLASFTADFLSVPIAFSAIFLGEGVVNLVGVVAALAAASAAWTQHGRHADLARSYHLLWQELLFIRDIAGPVITEQKLQDIVRAGEDAISRATIIMVAKFA